eukprot:14008656-Alexandrium_andersonii.AAC.1
MAGGSHGSRRGAPDRLPLLQSDPDPVRAALGLRGRCDAALTRAARGGGASQHLGGHGLPPLHRQAAPHR